MGSTCLVFAALNDLFTLSCFNSRRASVRRKVRWKPTSRNSLDKAENEMLAGTYHVHLVHRRYNFTIKYWPSLYIPLCSGVKSDFEKEFVDLPDGNKIWTLTFNKHIDKTPLVIVHGFAGGVGIWVTISSSSSSLTVV